ncbi:hypothetical protein [Saccharicrinis aurantiacus]|uniref:hypothetical protein n=1 Tax=Saccharicrinis aurantiacus TaxID=1849719 RepID=UPI002490A497|nr:hypothetical protein [Saccharicrinis aurantiacus]
MKHILLLFLFCVSATLVSAQFSYLNDVELESTADYSEYTETVYDCCDYLLLTPFSKKDSERVAATNFIERWVKGAPNSSYKVSENIQSLTDNRTELLGLYFTCIAKELVEGNADNSLQAEEKAITSFLDYCTNPMNKLKLTKEIKELAQLNNAGELNSLTAYYNSKNKTN